MPKGLWQITSGESYSVRANSEEEALAIFYVSQGFSDIDDYPTFTITEDDLNAVEYDGADTIAEFINE